MVGGHQRYYVMVKEMKYNFNEEISDNTDINYLEEELT